jgi:hypothetical protein
MTDLNRRIALKPYLETIEGCCSQLSGEELPACAITGKG